MHTKIVLALFMAAASITAACSNSEAPSETSTSALPTQAPSPAATEPASNLKQIQQQRSGDYIVSLLNETGQLEQGPNQLTLEFHNAKHELTAVGNVQITSTMAMPGMAPMVGTASVKPAGTPGRYDLSVDLGKTGRWDVVLTFDNGQKVQFALKAQ